MELLLIALRKLWPYLLGAALILSGAWYLHHRWYSEGAEARDAYWKPLFDAAERAREAATEKARRQEEDSKALSQASEAHYAETVSSLNLRAADAERRYASLLRQRPAGSCSGAVREDGGPAGNADATRASSELVDRTSRDFAALARRCEGDAAALTDLQEWVRGQQAILR